MTHTLPEIIGALTSGTRMSEAMRDQVIGIVERSGWQPIDDIARNGDRHLVGWNDRSASWQACGRYMKRRRVWIDDRGDAIADPTHYKVLDPIPDQRT